MKKNTKPDAKTGSSSKQDNSLSESDSSKIRKSRRRMIQVMVAGGVVVTAKSVPNKWSSPVVKSVILPAHAQTSGLITLGNNGNFFATNSQDMEKKESLLASGIDQGWAEIFDALVQEASAGVDDQQLICEFTGCSHIEYNSGNDSGQLFIGIFDISEDSLGPRDLILNFTDGQSGLLNEPCMPANVGFLVELINDQLARLTLLFGEKVFREIDLVDNFECGLAQDGTN